jgi:hypothetical protein
MVQTLSEEVEKLVDEEVDDQEVQDEYYILLEILIQQVIL